jgi:hypothetical protein
MVIVLGLIVLLFPFIISLLPKWLGLPPIEISDEIYMALTLIFGVAITMFLLYLTAISFSSLDLASPSSALGLPDGSIRALIALFLIIIFTLISVYLFRSIANPRLVLVPNVPENLLPLYADRIETTTLITNTNTLTNTYNLVVRSAVTETGEQAGLQIITLLGTLVTAVSAFYFGATAVAQAQRTTEKPSLSITNVYPKTGRGGDKPVRVTILGSGFMDGSIIKFVQDDLEPISPTVTNVVNTNEISGTFNLKDRMPGKYGVLVVNPDGAQFVKDNVFEIIGPDGEEKPTPEEREGQALQSRDST